MRKLQFVLSIILVAALSVPAIAIIAGEDKTYSENENRYLAARPAVSIESIGDGSFQTGLSDWLSDQFPGRDALMATGTQLKLATGRRDISDVYIGEDGFLFEKVTDGNIDMNLFRGNLERINTLARDNPDIDLTVMTVPSSGNILTDKLPANAGIYDSKRLLALESEIVSNGRIIDLTEDMRFLGEKGYYRTDHHWTTEGAYAGYRAFTDGLGSYDIDTEPLATVSEDFLGTLYSRTLVTDQPADRVQIAAIPDDVDVTADGRDIDVYDESALFEKDKYRLFFGGNYGLCEIKGTGSGTLLVIKDSFANCMVPYLIDDYETILMVDLRYFPGSVKSLISERGVEDILVLYELNNFATDRNITKLAM